MKKYSVHVNNLWESRQSPPLKEYETEVYFANEVDAVLARQASAAITGMNAARAISRNEIATARQLHAESQPELIESERSANALLTAENERLAAECERLREALAWVLDSGAIKIVVWHQGQRCRRLASHALCEPIWPPENLKAVIQEALDAPYRSKGSKNAVLDCATGATMSPVTLLAKGELNGECNRTACSQSPANWWNPNTRAYYCVECAAKINSFCPADMPQWRLSKQVVEGRDGA